MVHQGNPSTKQTFSLVDYITKALPNTLRWLLHQSSDSTKVIALSKCSLVAPLKRLLHHRHSTKQTLSLVGQKYAYTNRCFIEQALSSIGYITKCM